MDLHQKLSSGRGAKSDRSLAEAQGYVNRRPTPAGGDDGTSHHWITTKKRPTRPTHGQTVGLAVGSLLPAGQGTPKSTAFRTVIATAMEMGMEMGTGMAMEMATEMGREMERKMGRETATEMGREMGRETATEMATEMITKIAASCRHNWTTGQGHHRHP